MLITSVNPSVVYVGTPHRVRRCFPHGYRLKQNAPCEPAEYEDYEGIKYQGLVDALIADREGRVIGGNPGYSLDGVGELCRVHKSADIAHDNIEEVLKQRRVPYFVPILDILEVNGLAQAGEILFFERFVGLENAFRKTSEHEVFAKHGMKVARIRPESGELGKGERENLYGLASSAKFDHAHVSVFMLREFTPKLKTEMGCAPCYICRRVSACPPQPRRRRVLVCGSKQTALPKVESRIPNAGVNSIILGGIVEIAFAAQIEESGVSDKECGFKIAKILAHGRFVAYKIARSKRACS